MDDELDLRENVSVPCIETYLKALLVTKDSIQQIAKTSPAEVLNEEVEEDSENYLSWFRVVLKIRNIIQKIFGKLKPYFEDNEKQYTSLSHYYSKYFGPNDIVDLIEHETLNTITNCFMLKYSKHIQSNETNVLNACKFNDARGDDTTLRNYSTEDEYTSSSNNSTFDENEEYNVLSPSLEGNFKILFESAVMYHRKYSDLLQNWKHLNEKVNNCRKLMTEINSGTSEKIQKLVIALSNISKENKKLHFNIVASINHTDNLHEKIIALDAKKACSMKTLHEKEVFLENVVNETAKLSQCLRSFSELKQILQQHFQKRCVDNEKNAEQFLLNLTQKQEELQHTNSVFNGNKNTIIPPLKTEIQSWKNSLHEASKEVEKCTKYSHCLRKKKEWLHNEHALIERSIEDLRSNIIMQQESSKSKEKKCKQIKQDLENKYKELRNQLQKITNAILLDDMCYANLKISDETDSYKNELGTLINSQNESRKRKQSMNVQILNLNELIRIMYQQTAHMIENSYNFRQQSASEVCVSKGQLYLQAQGVSFLQEKQDKLKEDIKYFLQCAESVNQSKEHVALAAVVKMEYVNKLNKNVMMFEKMIQKYLLALGFRGPLVTESMEMQVENCSKRRREVIKLINLSSASLKSEYLPCSSECKYKNNNPYLVFTKHENQPLSEEFNQLKVRLQFPCYFDVKDSPLTDMYKMLICVT